MWWVIGSHTLWPNSTGCRDAFSGSSVQDLVSAFCGTIGSIMHTELGASGGRCKFCLLTCGWGWARAIVQTSRCARALVGGSCLQLGLFSGLHTQVQQGQQGQSGAWQPTSSSQHITAGVD